MSWRDDIARRQRLDQLGEQLGTRLDDDQPFRTITVEKAKFEMIRFANGVRFLLPPDVSEDTEARLLEIALGRDDDGIDRRFEAA